jgi:hypothetical protein
MWYSDGIAAGNDLSFSVIVGGVVVGMFGRFCHCGGCGGEDT